MRMHPLYVAFLTRAARMYGRPLILWAMGIGTCAGVSIALLPEMVHGIPLSQVQLLRGMISIESADGTPSPELVLNASIAPAFLGVVGSALGSILFPATVGDDTRTGTIETLLSRYARRVVIRAYALTGLIVSLSVWLVLLLSFGTSAYIVLTLEGAAVWMAPAFASSLVAFPAASIFFSVTVTFYGVLIYPDLLTSGWALNGGPIRLVAMLPPLLVILSTIVSVEALPFVAIFGSLCMILVSAAGIASSGRLFSAARILRSR